MYLVDTNVLSEARRASDIAVRWTRSVDASNVFISVMTLGEIARGIALKRRTDPVAAARIEDWLGWIRSRHVGRILAITDQIAIEWGRINAIRPRSDADALIAATAIIHKLTVVTRNTRDFRDTGVAVLDPWDRS